MRVAWVILAGLWTSCAVVRDGWAAAPSLAATTIDDGDFQQVYLSKADALAHVFPRAQRIVELRHVLSDVETSAIEALVGRRLEEGGFYLYAAWDDDPPTSGGGTGTDATRVSDGGSSAMRGAPSSSAAPSSYAVIVMEIGKVRPITHIVEVRPGGVDGRRAEAGRVAVMIYRETHGAEVASERFMAQYAGKSLDDPIRVDRDVINVAGSTLSAHAICRGVRKALAAVQVVLLGRVASERAALLAGASDVTPVRAPATTVEDAADTARTASAGDDLVVRERRVMGTLARVTLPRSPDGPSHAALESAADAALDVLQHWDDVLSDWRADTPLSRFNRVPPGEPVSLDEGLLAFLRHADALVRATDGAFDPALGEVGRTWGLRTPTPSRPTAAALARARASSGWTRLQFDARAGTATRLVDGVTLDPGASGKGFALDRAAEALRARGITCALLSFRSTLLALGAPLGARGFVVPVRHDGDGRVLDSVVLADGALSVSGGLAAGFDDGDVVRGHVLDPRDGVPVPSGRMAWVTAASAADADALSTALLVSGPELPAFVDAAGRRAAGMFVDDLGAEPRAWPASASASDAGGGGSLETPVQAPAQRDR